MYEKLRYLDWAFSGEKPEATCDFARMGTDRQIAETVAPVDTNLFCYHEEKKGFQKILN